MPDCDPSFVGQFAESRIIFARSFWARFGVTPREARALASQQLPRAEGDPSPRRMWEWIQMLR